MPDELIFDWDEEQECFVEQTSGDTVKPRPIEEAHAEPEAEAGAEEEAEAEKEAEEEEPAS